MSAVLELYKNKKPNILRFKLATLSFKTPRLIYIGHRVLFRLTNGLWNDFASFIFTLFNKKYQKIEITNSILGNDIESKVPAIVKKIEEDGYYIFENKIDPALVDELVKFSLETPIRAIKPMKEYNSKISYEEEEKSLKEIAGKSARLQYETARLINHKVIQKLMFDEGFLKIAQDYLKCKPILDLVTMWWSFPVENAELYAAASAQKFHFDMDRLKLVKFFIYLTDVGPENGPHCFVKGSHKTLPRRFLKRGRFEDKDVSDEYSADDIKEIGGLKGSVIAVDTRGLHKGKIPTAGNRLLLQVQYVNSLFGEYYEPWSIEKVCEEKESFVRKHYQTFFNFFSSGN